jgi:hypothetical protein
MSAGMNIELAIAIVLGLAAILATARLLYRQYRSDAATRSRGWRMAVLLIAQPLIAALLYFAVLPPRLPGQAGTMIVSTAGAADGAGQGAGDIRVALPEAPPAAVGERVPDLASALRRHPGTQRLRVLGAGLPPRDRDAARGLAIEFVPAPLPRGLSGLWSPARVGEGEEFWLSGRVEAMPGGSVELFDPGSQRVDRAMPRGDGGFALSAVARSAGLAMFQLRLRDARQQVIEQLDVPVAIEARPAPKLLLLAGAPGPELKYLRRWAADAGLKPYTQISVGAGLQLGDAPLNLNAATLAGFDLLVLDERAWESLGETQRNAVIAAVRGGLGVLLRVGGPLSPRTRAQLRALGFEPGAGADASELRLPAIGADEAATRARLGPGSVDAPRPRDQAPAEAPALTRRVLALDSATLQPLARDADGKAYAAWRALGQGRIALWGLSDSFKLVLAGRDDLHGRLWSDALSTLTRARSSEPARIDGTPRQDARTRVCGLADGAQVLPPRGPAVALVVDPDTGRERCAGFWPTSAGWHSLRQGERLLPFYVRARDEAPGLRASELREATAGLSLVSAQRDGAATGALAADGERGSPWPWFFAWLALSAGLWWFERSLRGRYLTAE